MHSVHDKLPWYKNKLNYRKDEEGKREREAESISAGLPCARNANDIEKDVTKFAYLAKN